MEKENGILEKIRAFEENGRGNDCLDEGLQRPCQDFESFEQTSRSLFAPKAARGSGRVAKGNPQRDNAPLPRDLRGPQDQFSTKASSSSDRPPATSVENHMHIAESLGFASRAKARRRSGSRSSLEASLSNDFNGQTTSSEDESSGSESRRSDVEECGSESTGSDHDMMVLDEAVPGDAESVLDAWNREARSLGARPIYFFNDVDDEAVPKFAPTGFIYTEDSYI